MDKESVKVQARARALDRAFVASRLYDERYFPDISKAVKTKDKSLWLDTCEKAGIPVDMSKYMWEILSTTKAELMNVW
jgi:hypothetical protein